MSTPLLEVSNLCAGYSSKAPVLHDVSFRVAEGRAVGITGMNGAGKSTLLKVVAGQLAATQGEVLLRGVGLGRRGPAARVRSGLSFLPEGHQVLRSLTVHENLLMAAGGLTRRRAGRALARHEDLIYELFPILRERSTQLAGLLSGGEQQMLSLSRSIIHEPALLVLDEPSLGLAPVVVARIYDAIGSLRARGVSLLVVEQSSTRLRDLCDELIVLKKGRIVAEGNVRELTHDDVQAAYF